MTERFAPYQDLARFLLDAFDADGTDGSHDLSHIVRVWRNASRIARAEPSRIARAEPSRIARAEPSRIAHAESSRVARAEPECDTELLLAAVILHDCVAVEKSSPLRAQASRLSAARAREIVGKLGWAEDRVNRLAHAIETHSFSANLRPETLEAKIMRDADRLDAIGAIGVARCFHVGGRMGGALYHPGDPGAESRPLDDRAYALDHFPAKLFKVAEGFLTSEGQRMAAARAALMTEFVAAFRAEVEGE